MGPTRPSAASRLLAAVGALAVMLGLAPPAVASSPFVYDAEVDGAITVAGAAFWIGTEAHKDALAGPSCRWCDDGDGGLNPLDARARRALRWRHPEAADRASNVLAYGVLPLAAFGAVALMPAPSPGEGAASTESLVLLEGLVLTADLHQVAKFSARRERPYTRFGGKSGAAVPDDHLSFYSAHTDTAFALASGCTLIAYERESPWAPYVAASGFGLAATTGRLRVAADRHYLSDVLTGAAMGTAIGAYVPWSHRRRPATTVGRVAVSFPLAAVDGRPAWSVLWRW
jgi:membrane-associated phospholipid phosphatase